MMIDLDCRVNSKVMLSLRCAFTTMELWSWLVLCNLLRGFWVVCYWFWIVDFAGL